MTPQQLKPCPFCQNTGKPYLENQIEEFGITCAACACNAPIITWNTPRSLPQDTVGLVLALEEIADSHDSPHNDVIAREALAKYTIGLDTSKMEMVTDKSFICNIAGVIGEINAEYVVKTIKSNFPNGLIIKLDSGGV